MTEAGTVEGTVVFTDIVGFTAFCAEEGDEHALEVLAAQEAAVSALLPADARVVKELGDGMMLWFPDAASAVSTAVLLQSQLGHDGDEPVDGGATFPLWIRVGAHTGTQARRRDDLVGHDVNVAARIVDLASPREVLVSDATRRASGDGLEGVGFVELGPVFVKGVADPVWIHRAEPAAWGVQNPDR
ncbi:MAG: adenylate/guanylate cyclase domain-containing protein [Acidimicrobiales bacterium]